MSEKQQLTQHILPTSSNLLGICFVILSFIKVGDKGHATLLDECIILPIILFFVASMLSYVSMRSSTDKPRIEHIADNVFMAGLMSLSLIAVILVLKFIN